MEVNNYNGAFLPDEDYSDPDLVAEAQHLVDKLQSEMHDLCADYQAEGTLPPNASAYFGRLGHVLARAEDRLERRLAADPFSEADYYDHPDDDPGFDPMFLM